MNLGIRRAATVLVTAGLAAAASILPASATTTLPVTGGSGDWGVKLSFRNYIKSPIAHGSTELSGGVTENPDGTYSFPIVSGSYDTATGDTVIQFGGSVAYEGHGGVLRVRIDDLRLEITNGKGELYATWPAAPPATRRWSATPTSTWLTSTSAAASHPQRHHAEPRLYPGHPHRGGQPRLRGFYSPGAELDPISFTATVGGSNGGGNQPPANGGSSAQQQILADVAAGPLILSVAGDTVQLTQSAPNGDGTYQTATGALNTATVSDLRGTNAGWNLVGQVSDFTGDVGTIGAENLGWTPSAAAVNTGVGTPGTVTAGSTFSS